jgi:hypothetical protein
MIALFNKQTFQPQRVPRNNSILPLFSELDDFCQSFEPAFKIKQLESGTVRRHRKASQALIEVMTILVWLQFAKSAHCDLMDWHRLRRGLYPQEFF